MVLQLTLRLIIETKIIKPEIKLVRGIKPFFTTSFISSRMFYLVQSYSYLNTKNKVEKDKVLIIFSQK